MGGGKGIIIFKIKKNKKQESLFTLCIGHLCNSHYNTGKSRHGVITHCPTGGRENLMQL